jgi:hypothetical protein
MEYLKLITPVEGVKTENLTRIESVDGLREEKIISNRVKRCSISA